MTQCVYLAHCVACLFLEFIYSVAHFKCGAIADLSMDAWDARLRSRGTRDPTGRVTLPNVGGGAISSGGMGFAEIWWRIRYEY